MQDSSGRRDKNIIMSLFVVVAVVSLGFICISVLVGLALGAILGQISREMSDLLEQESWQREPTFAANWASRAERADLQRKLPAPAA